MIKKNLKFFVNCISHQSDHHIQHSNLLKHFLVQQFLIIICVASYIATLYCCLWHACSLNLVPTNIFWWILVGLGNIYFVCVCLRNPIEMQSVTLLQFPYHNIITTWYCDKLTNGIFGNLIYIVIKFVWERVSKESTFNRGTAYL